MRRIGAVKKKRSVLPRRRGGSFDNDRYETAKRIDSYNYGSRDGAHIFAIDLYIVRSHGESLAAYCPELNIRTDDRDLAVVKERMADAIEEKISYVWEPWLELRVTSFVPEDPDLFSSEHGMISLEIDITQWDFAEREGKRFHRIRGDTSRSAVSEGWKEPTPQDHAADHRGMYVGKSWSGSSVIRDTPEARAAISRIQDGMNMLIAKLGTLLSQQQIERTLAQVLAGSSPLALPAETTTKKKR